MELSSNAWFELKAEVYRLETGKMAPGKDSREPQPAYDERLQLWKDWQAANQSLIDSFFMAIERVL